MCFVSLGLLTKTLGRILAMVYSLKGPHDDAQRTIRQIECRLDDWEVAVETNLAATNHDSEDVNGKSNVWFCYLSVRLLLARVAFRVCADHH